MTRQYFSFTPTVRRNSLFVGLTEEQRDELGGVEYRAIKALLWVLPIYFLGSLFFSSLCLGLWIIRDPYYGDILARDGINRGWWAIFTTASFFSNDTL